jgi:hypothetical protein
MTRGRCDWLELQRTELASATTCRSSRRTENVGFQFLSLRHSTLKYLNEIMRRRDQFAQNRLILETVAKEPSCKRPGRLAAGRGSQIIHRIHV